jgi:hypothetical protein
MISIRREISFEASICLKPSFFVFMLFQRENRLEKL